MFTKGRGLLCLCAIALAALALVGCSPYLQVGVMGTPETEPPTADTSAAATIAALSTENAKLVKQLTPEPPGLARLGRLAYVQAGDIWARALPDGVPQRLTEDGLNRQPRWAPSGQRLAFIKGREGFVQLWTMLVDGSEARSLATLPDGLFAWSPAADTLAYVDADGLHVVSAGETEPTTLVPAEPVEAATPDPDLEGVTRSIRDIAWSPDGNWIAVQWQAQLEDGPLVAQGIEVVSKEGGETISVVEADLTEEGDAILAGWTSDSRWVLYWQGPTVSASILADGVPLYAVPAKGGEPRQLVDTMLAYDDFLAPGPGGGSQLAAAVGEYRATWTQKMIQVLNLEEDDALTVTGPELAAISPAWAPDGHRLAYVAMPDEGDLSGDEAVHDGLLQRRLWVTDLLASSMPRQLTDDDDYRDERPLWSADGSQILFARLDEADRASLWLIPAEGGEPTQVVEELTPAPDWFGFFGHIEWDGLFDWWHGPEPTTPQPTPTPGVPSTAGAVTPTGQPGMELATATPAASADSTPTAGTEVIIDCAQVFPGLPGCLGEEPLAEGLLAFVDQRPAFSGRPVLADLETGRTAILGENPARVIGWSPSGERLLVAEGERAYKVYRRDGTLEQDVSEAGRDPFWAPTEALPGSEDWLAVPRDDGSLWVIPFFGTADAREILPPGALGEEGRARVLWSEDGQLAWTPHQDQLAGAGRWEQDLSVRSAEPGTKVVIHRLSNDIRVAYYELISWVPGTDLILAGQGVLSASIWADGVPLVTINTTTGEIRELDAIMLLTSEAYDWHPAEVGLLALAEGAGRFITQNKRLALLDVIGGDLEYLTDTDMVAFEPAWSPDGEILAYAAAPASPDAQGGGDDMEESLSGRSVYLYDGEVQRLTDPGEAVDGWPRWSADGSQLLYTRQQDGSTDVRVMAVDGSVDDLLITGLEDPMCFFGGCGWQRLLAFQP
ncbi:MAG: TolB family protein [Anaerolineae bacterium]|jgi:Tol biopolymer transport system component